MEISEQLIKKEWYEESCEARPLFLSLPSHAIGDTIASTKNQYRILLNFYEGLIVYWQTLVEDQDIITKEILFNYLQNKDYYKTWFKKWKKETKKFKKLYEQIKTTILSELSEEELLSKHDNLWNQLIKCRSISMIIDPFIFGSERIMMAELKEYCQENNISNFSEVYTNLTLAEEESFLKQLEDEVIDITLNLKRKKQQSILQDKEKLLTKSFVKKHFMKYSWVNCNWGGKGDYGFEQLVEKINSYLDKDIAFLKRKKINLSKTNKRIRKDILEKYEFTKRIRALSELASFFTHWQDLRKENALKYVDYESDFVDEFSRRYSIEKDKLLLFDIIEIRKAVKDKEWFEKECKERKELFLIVRQDLQLNVIKGDKAKELFNQIVKKEMVLTKEIKGMTASSGNAKGYVRIVHAKNEFSKFKQGEILVTGMTRPEFGPLMAKAVAIVTDDGGISSHAAIISRELKKPCITGTRVATKALNDGDLVEVDADNGIVRLIKKA